MPRKDARMTRSPLLIALAAAAMLLVGCGGTSKIRGKVVPGPVGVATVVASDDERLENPGLAGVEVALLRDAGPRGGGVIAKVVSDETGSFEIPLGRGQHPGGAVVVRVQGDSVFSAHTRSFLPSGGQHLLCTAVERTKSPDS